MVKLAVIVCEVGVVYVLGFRRGNYEDLFFYFDLSEGKGFGYDIYPAPHQFHQKLTLKLVLNPLT